MFSPYSQVISFIVHSNQISNSPVSWNHAINFNLILIHSPVKLYSVLLIFSFSCPGNQACCYHEMDEKKSSSHSERLVWFGLTLVSLGPFQTN